MEEIGRREVSQIVVSFDIDDVIPGLERTSQCGLGNFCQTTDPV